MHTCTKPAKELLTRTVQTKKMQVDLYICEVATTTAQETAGIQCLSTTRQA